LLSHISLNVCRYIEAAVRGAVATNAGDACGVAGGVGGMDAAHVAHVENLARENVILKRAVAIQNQRQQDHGGALHVESS
jgi:hypothetical protein